MPHLEINLSIVGVQTSQTLYLFSFPVVISNWSVLPVSGGVGEACPQMEVVSPCNSKCSTQRNYSTERLTGRYSPLKWSKNHTPSIPLELPETSLLDRVCVSKAASSQEFYQGQWKEGWQWHTKEVHQQIISFFKYVQIFFYHIFFLHIITHFFICSRSIKQWQCYYHRHKVVNTIFNHQKEEVHHKILFFTLNTEGKSALQNNFFILNREKDTSLLNNTWIFMTLTIA